MSNPILNDLDELLSQRVITDDEATRIRNYYNQKPQPESNRLVIVFGILGSLLVGMGLVLIIAHNWDVLPKPVKLTVALLPLFIGQVICGYLLWKKSTSVAWREGVSVFVVFAVATAIAIVSQVYNIEGNFANFLFVWMLLCFPLMYVMRSSAASLLFWIGITWYACEDGYFHSYSDIPYKYWILALAATPWYGQLCTRMSNSNFTYVHHWIVAGSVIITLGTFADHSEELLIPAYMFLFGIFILIGQLPIFSAQRLLTNAYLILGSLGVVTLLLMLSFDWYWVEVERRDVTDWIFSTEAIVCAALIVLAVILLLRLLKTTRATELLSKSYVIPVFIVLFIIGNLEPYGAQILTNVFILVLAVYTIREGARADHLGRMNYGLMILTLLIICRFFDTDLSFVIRGLLFVAVGLGFFGMNYRMVKKRKERNT
jgi:uncharacterized membrane protein